MEEPASETDFEEAEASVGFSLPDSLKACYRLGNGSRDRHGRYSLSIRSLDEAIRYGGSAIFLSSRGAFAAMTGLATRIGGFATL